MLSVLSATNFPIRLSEKRVLAKLDECAHFSAPCEVVFFFLLHTCCCSAEAETGFVPTSAQFFAVGTFVILRAPVLDFHQEAPRVDVFRSLSSSKSIRQRIRRRTVTLFQSSLEFPDLGT